VRSRNVANGHIAKTQRQHDAQNRQQARAERTPEQQVEALNHRLGASRGAVRERARLVGPTPVGKTKTSRQKRAKQKARA
jgi:hypothetical protein